MKKTTKNLVRCGLGVFGLLLAFSYGSACGGDENTNTGNDCVPNATQACTGPGACMGSQVCAADGKSWSACDCGGTTTTTGQGGAGSTTTGTGGMSTTTTGTGGMPTTTTSTGGMPTGAGGMPTTTTSTGTGNPADCEPMEPTSMDPCMTPVIGCIYGDQHCECWQLGGGGTTWDCDTCPMAQPMDGDTCMTGSGGINRCFYGATTCACIGGGGGGTWSCNVCPAQEPMSGDPCTETGIHCMFPSANCSCLGFMGMGQWTCF